MNQKAPKTRRVLGSPALFRQAFGLAMFYPAQKISLHKMLGQDSQGERNFHLVDFDGV
jgi:hypothetical protein